MVSEEGMNWPTSVDDVAFVKIVNCFEDLLDGLGGIFLRELALVANAVEQLSTRSKLGHNVEFVLAKSAPFDPQN